MQAARSDHPPHTNPSSTLSHPLATTFDVAPSKVVLTVAREELSREVSGVGWVSWDWMEVAVGTKSARLGSES